MEIGGPSSKVLQPDSTHSRKAEQGGFEDLSWELARGGPLPLSLPQGHFQPVRSRAASRRGCRKTWSRGEGGAWAQRQCLWDRLPCCFLKLESTWENPGLGQGLMGLQFRGEGDCLCVFVDMALPHPCTSPGLCLREVAHPCVSVCVTVCL